MNIKLRKVREEKGYSQEEIADFLNISQPQYYRKESGISKFSEEEWNKMADFYGVSIHDIRDEMNSIITISSIQNDKGNNYSSYVMYFSDQLVAELKDHIETLKIQIDMYKKLLNEKEIEIDKLQQEG